LIGGASLLATVNSVFGWSSCSRPACCGTMCRSEAASLAETFLGGNGNVISAHGNSEDVQIYGNRWVSLLPYCPGSQPHDFSELADTYKRVQLWPTRDEQCQRRFLCNRQGYLEVTIQCPYSGKRRLGTHRPGSRLSGSGRAPRISATPRPTATVRLSRIYIHRRSSLLGNDNVASTASM